MKRRFVGPFLLSILLCYSFVDYISYSRVGRSPLAGLWRVLGILAGDAYRAIVSVPFFSDTVFLLLTGISGTGIVLVWMSVRQAKKAMDSATELNAVPAFENTQIGAREARREMASKAAPVSMPRRSSIIGLVGMMIGGFAFTAGMFCLLSLVIVYFGLLPVFEKESHKRSSLLAAELNDIAASYVVEKNLSALNKEVARYASRSEIAYIAIKDNRGKLIAQSPADSRIIGYGSFPKESLGREPSATIRYRGRAVNEILVEMDKGRTGLLYLGIWSDVPEQQLRRVLWPLGWSVGVILMAIVISFSLFLAPMRRRFRRLVQSAEQISKGNLEVAVSVGREDEIDELGCSIERMRSSLKAVMIRLEEGSS